MQKRRQLMPDRDEVRLVALAGAGDRSALGRLYQRYATSVYRTALRWIGDLTEAEDVVQDVFIEAWQMAAAYDPRRGTVRSWLMVRARSRAIDRKRRQARWAACRQRMVGGAPAPRDAAETSLEAQRVLEEIAGLPTGHREVIELAYVRGFSCSEIAGRSLLPLGTVKARLRNGRKRVQRQLLAPVRGYGAA